MIRAIILTIYWFPICVVCSPVIQQSPKHLLRRAEEKEAKLFCRHGDNDYPYLYWYQQKSNSVSLELIGMLNYGSASKENKFEPRFDIKGHAKEDAFLIISNINAEDSAVYFCAASGSGNYPAHFGSGTKLTVLARQQKDPIVEILKPSGIETSCKKTVTLVCVAKNFYPDHVSVRWTLEGKEIEKNIATDPYAIQDKDTQLFSISSRLQVPKKEFKPKHKYTCTMKYYYETDKYRNVSSSIIGTEVGGYEPESYVNSAQWMKLAYGVFIAKSGLYGLVVLVYVMRKGSSGK